MLCACMCVMQFSICCSVNALEHAVELRRIGRGPPPLKAIVQAHHCECSRVCGGDGAKPIRTPAHER